MLLSRPKLLIKIALCLILSQQLGCYRNQEEREPQLSTNILIDHAKNWLKTAQANTENLAFASIKLDWNSSIIHDEPTRKIIELDIKNSPTIAVEILSPFTSHKEKAVPEESKRKLLLILKDNANEFSVVYLNIFSGQASGGYNYKKASASFSGFVFFTSVSEQIINGWEYKNGNVVNKVRPSSHGTNLREGDEDGCEQKEVQWFRRICTYYDDLSVECTSFTYHHSTYVNVCPGTGTGGVSDVYQEESIYKLDPCTKARLLKNDTAFITKMTELKTKAATDNFESGYLISRTSIGTTTYLAPSSTNVTAGFAISNLSGQYDGIIHNHYSGLLPIFSDYDIQSMYKLVQNNATDPSRFTMGLVTDEGTTYLLQVNDLRAFRKFGLEYLADDSGFLSFGQLYSAWTLNSNPEQKELGLVRLLETLNSGLTLVRGNPNTFGSWSKLSYVDGVLIIQNCN